MSHGARPARKGSAGRRVGIAASTPEACHGRRGSRHLYRPEPQAPFVKRGGLVFHNVSYNGVLAPNDGAPTMQWKTVRELKVQALGIWSSVTYQHTLRQRVN